MSTDRNGRPIPPGRTRAIIYPGTRSRQSLERSRGLPEPIDPDRHYIVEPGEPGGGEEYWPKPGQSPLAGLNDSIARAAWLSMGHGAQRVWRVSPDSEPKVIRRYTGGNAMALVPETGDAA